jgi:hypothetical protein
VPTTVVAAPVDSGLYPDPYYGMNLRSIPGTTYDFGDNFGSDNYFELMPGEDRELTATYPRQLLNGAGSSIRVEGWNLAATAPQQ